MIESHSPLNTRLHRPIGVICFQAFNELDGRKRTWRITVFSVCRPKNKDALRCRMPSRYSLVASWNCSALEFHSIWRKKLPCSLSRILLDRRGMIHGRKRTYFSISRIEYTSSSRSCRVIISPSSPIDTNWTPIMMSKNPTRNRGRSLREVRPNARSMMR